MIPHIASRPRPAALAFAGFAFCLSALGGSIAHASPDVELGAFVGAHFFNPDSALGRESPAAAATPGGAPQSMLMGGLRLSWFPIRRLGLEIEGGVIPTWLRSDTSALAPVFVYRANVLINILTGRVRPFVLAGIGGTSLVSSDRSAAFNDSEVVAHLGAGVLVDIGANWGVRIDARLMFPSSLGSTPVTVDGELLAGFWTRFGGGAVEYATRRADVKADPDTDGDGILDRVDACPREPGPPETRGCPDRDGDGTPDVEDHCPNKKGPRENGGCPDVDLDGDGIPDRFGSCKGGKRATPEVDSDGDGTPDSKDKCPTLGGPIENAGCPDADTDGDEVIDRLDKCPTVPGKIENAGCPDTDTDNDGIPDALDKCPKKPETKNFFEDEDGCPDVLPRDVAQYTGVIRGIEFKPGTAELLPKSTGALSGAAKMLLKWKALRIEIGGHTDDQGDAAGSNALSRDQAEAVREVLIKSGVAKERLVAVGYGGEKPSASNETTKGQKANRRIEFKLIK